MPSSRRFALAVALIAAGLLVIGLSHWLAPSWFAVRTFGLGFRPATWQGWVAVLVGLASIVVGTRVVRRR